MMEFLPIAFIVTAFWFPVYWILGGVAFAAIAIARTMKLRRAQFSCLFTVTSIACAFGASCLGIVFTSKNGTACLVEEASFLDTLSGVVGCGILEFVGAGVLGFVALFGLGVVELVISRAANQSWMDSDFGLDDVTEVTFDNLKGRP